MALLSLYASAPRALCEFLRTEIRDCGGERTTISGAGVAFHGDLEVAYRACLWSRVASRVLVELQRFPAPDADELYTCSHRIDWAQHLDHHSTIAVDCSTRAARITHSHFAALRVKDAIVDWFTQHGGERPNVDTRSPDLRLHLHLRGGEARLYLDLAGAGLHRRGYRSEAGPAPLRETLAAGLLYFAQWPRLASEGRVLFDPLCGAGTLVIEAALMAADIAPGSFRERFGFEGWLRHDPDLWRRLTDEADARRQRGLATLPDLSGSDLDAHAVAAAGDNARRAGLPPAVRFEQRDVRDVRPGAAHGLLVSNPPYGKRISARDDAWREPLRERFPGWRIALLLPADHPSLNAASNAMEVRNGPLHCKVECADQLEPEQLPAIDVSAFRNRLAKRGAHLARWARRREISCYRLYDADVPEFALAIDRYQGDESWLHVAEYEAPASIDPLTAQRRVEAAVAVLEEQTDTPRARIVVKQRRRQRGSSQYQRLDGRERTMEIREHAARLLVNLEDHLDTGLFLDHRAIRRWLHGHASGKRFLNLFAYTASASVHAALGGAASSLSIDMSRGYCEWARSNLSINGFEAPQHQVLEADCMHWLAHAPTGHDYDLIFMDPPTFSNSSRMQATLDVQRDHVALIGCAMQRLTPAGALIFSSNRRGFRLDEQGLADLRIEDITSMSLDEDFPRAPPAHRCYRIGRPAA